MLSKLLQICHEWYQDCHTEFDYSNKLGFVHAHKSKIRLQKKKKRKNNDQQSLCYQLLA